jgi:osmotically-inducible protein OsmY
MGLEDHIVRTMMAGANGRAGGNRPAGDQDSDKAIAARVTEALRRERREDLSDVSVRVDRGVAHLSGTTPGIAGKALAQQVASPTPGVRSVVNGIEADTVVRARVEAALAEDPSMALVPIEVVCRAGVVTLLGEVPSVETREAAEQIARSTPGVVAVINELAVRPRDMEPVNARPLWQETPG